MARVFLGRRSRGKYFFVLYASLSAAFCFWEITVNTCAIESLTTLLQNEQKTQFTKRDSDKQNNHNSHSERVRIVHFGELVRGATGDLSHSKQSELRLQILQLVQQLRLRLVPQLVHLYPRFNAGKELTQNRRKKQWHEFESLLQRISLAYPFRRSTRSSSETLKS